MAPRGDGVISVDVDSQENMKVCVYNDRSVTSKGIFFGDYPFYFTLPVTLFQVSFVALFSQVIYFVLKPIKTPRCICQAFAGILVGPSFLGHNKAFKDRFFPPSQFDVLSVASLLGIIYTVFIIALKMDVALTLRSAKRTWKLGILPFFFSFWVMLALLHMYGPDSIPGLRTSHDRILLCVNVSFSNFTVISQALLDLNLITSELGQIALSSAMVNDMLHGVYLVSAYLLRSKSDGKHSVLLILISFWAFMASCAFIIRPTLLMIARRTSPGKPVKKIYIVFILVGVLFMAFITDFIGLSCLYGPLFFGLVMPNGPPLGTTVLEKTEVLVNELFLPMAWAFLGAQINVFGIWSWGVVSRVNFVVVAGYVAKVVGCILISLSYKIRVKHGLVLGLLLNMKGIIEFIIYTRMRKIQMLDDQLFYFLVFSTVLTTTILHPFVELLYKPHTRLDSYSKHHKPIRTIQGTYRNPEFSIVCCVHNEGNVRSLISLIEACNPDMSSAICAYVVHLIELQGTSTPFLLPVDLQRRRFSSFNYPITHHIMRAFENYSCKSDGLLTVLPYMNVAPYKNMHEAVCNLAQDKLVSLIILPFHENDQLRGSLKTFTIRDLNHNFQLYTPCTVGILVDRFSQLGMTVSTDIGFHVAIFFLGGPDDREALALGNRMSEHTNMRVTLFWFVVKNDYMGDVSDNEEDRMGKFDRKLSEGHEGEERAWDESVIDEFKAKNMGNGNAVCQEIEVEDGVRVLEAIRGLEGNYDLIMVGQRHNLGGLEDKEMSNFMENVETLGIIGDMLASSEFCNGMVPVLVMRSGMKQPKRLRSLDSTAISHRSFGSKFAS